MEKPVKGTVTSLSNIFPPEEAQKASIRVEEKIAEHRKELDQFQEFVADNTRLVNLVQRLPDELHHEIMVPFGKAAFFPGRLIHTNEFMVLLGEGYYADKTSKQTTEILIRRGKALESQVESIKAVMQDLKAEASFFNDTATEAAEGLLEITEEYIEETSEMESETGLSESKCPEFPKKDNKVVVEDEEYARLLSRMDELEKEEELAAENSSDSDENEECAPTVTRVDALEKGKTKAKISERDLEQSEANVGHSMIQQSITQKHKIVKFEDQKLQRKPEGGNSLAPKKVNSTEKIFMLPEVKENVQATSSTSKKEAFTGAIVQHSPSIEKKRQERTTDSSKAFTGTIVERSPTVLKNSGEQTAASSKFSTSQASKPVSRFKMQRK